MPAEIVTGEYCSSWFATYQVPSNSRRGHFYLVTLSGGEGPPYCACKGFEYRQTCSHLERVHREACLWNCQWHDGNTPVLLRPVAARGTVIPESACGNCGAPLVAVRIAV